MRVLVVDDDASVRETLSELLRAGGHVVTTAADFGEAEALLATPDWDVMLADQMLPGGSGLDLVTLAQAHGVHAVICSGHPQYIEDLAKHGIAHLIKPFSAAALEAALSTALADGDDLITET